MAVGVNDLYSTILGRQGSAEDTSYWSNLFGNDVDYAEGKQFLQAASPELQNRANSSNTLSSLYGNVLGRQGDVGGVDAWSNQIGTGGVTSDIQKQFWESAQPELNNRLSGMFTPAPTAPVVNPNQTAVTGGTMDTGVMNSSVTKPIAPNLQSVQTPQWINDYNNKYKETFTNPQAYWNEYSQGMGASVTEAAARGMAKSGRTGLMPTLQTQAYQDYMTNYLPTVREGLAKGLSYDQAMNTNLENMYGQQLDYSKGIYGSEVNAYGSQLGLEQSKLTAMTAAGNQETQKAIAALENMGKMYQVDAQTMQQMYSSMASMFPHMDDVSRQAFIDELGMALMGSDYSNKINQITPKVTNDLKDSIGFSDGGGG